MKDLQGIEDVGDQDCGNKRRTNRQGISIVMQKGKKAFFLQPRSSREAGSREEWAECQEGEEREWEGGKGEKEGRKRRKMGDRRGAEIVEERGKGRVKGE